VTALTVAACSGSSDSTTLDADDGTDSGGSSADPTSPSASVDDPVDSAPADSDPVTSETDSVTDSVVDSTAGDDQGGDPADDSDFSSLDAPTGDPIVIGMVNTEGPAGLDFPELRTDTDLAVDYLNQHGGMGGRPIVIEHCAAAGSPETSQACAQELSGKDVEMVMLGLDIFPGYSTFAASDIPVFGALPILPADYTADALFFTGGNATTMAGIVGLAVEHLDAKTVGIISADNPGANSSEQALTGALDKAGLTYTSIKGGDSETDAGFQGLLREANQDNPDVLVSLYADAGCIGAMRGRVALGITTPVISTPICASGEVIDVVGDDALGWFFVGAAGAVETATPSVFEQIIEPTYGADGTGGLGIGALGIQQVMSLARVANRIAADGGDVTGQSIYDTLKTTTDIVGFPNGFPHECGRSATYPAVCSFVFPASEYAAGGGTVTVPGFEGFSVVDYLP
jgi:branched-chain amino acid transport system substrate-binding protein